MLNLSPINVGLDLNLEYRDLKYGDLESISQKEDQSIPYNHAPHPTPTPTHPTPQIKRDSRSFEIDFRYPFFRLEIAEFEINDLYQKC
jgi:hypothetical protein